jgi:hypothetical protein
VETDTIGRLYAEVRSTRTLVTSVIAFHWGGDSADFSAEVRDEQMHMAFDTHRHALCELFDLLMKDPQRSGYYCIVTRLFNEKHFEERPMIPALPILIEFIEC